MSTSHSESRSGLVVELAEEFLERYRAGQRPALREYIERHPELAAEIREVFPAMAMMENIALADESPEGDPTGGAHVTRAPLLEQLGDYRVLREVGRGGMGVVYEAEQVSLGRLVALKVLPPQMLRDHKTRRRFEREARAAAKLHHTNIVPVFGVGEHDDTPYYVMQFIQGQGLDAVLKELNRLRTGKPAGDDNQTLTATHPDISAADVARSLLTGRFDAQGAELVAGRAEVGPGSAVTPTPSSSSLMLHVGDTRGKTGRQTYWQGVARIGAQVADALAYAHAQGIIHRDIKPSNLLLDTRGTVWVTDFGLAKADDGPNLTHTGDILGTLRYMPPEAFRGKVDARGDVYALGLTLYEMLAFRPAFDEKERGRLVRQVTDEAPPPLRRLNAEVPRDLETIVQKAIEREATHRYASASELADDLRRFVDDEPIQARRASIAERLARWGRRNPAVAGLAAAVALLMIAVTGSLGFGYEAAKRALIVQTKLRTDAELEKQRAELEKRNAERATARESDQKAIAIAEKQKAESANKALQSSQDSLRSTLYAAQMNLAKVAWDSGAPSRMLDLLAATVPKPGESDPRGFEWHYWRRNAHGERTVRKLPGFGQPGLSSRVFSPDGRLAASLDSSTGQSRSRKLLVYETATGRLARKIPLEFLNPNNNSSLSHAIAFSGDAKVVAVHIGCTQLPGTMTPTNQDWQIQTIVWSLGDGREVFHDSEVVSALLVWPMLSVNGDGSRIATGWSAYDSSVASSPKVLGSFRVLDVTRGHEHLHVTSSTESHAAAELSSDGRLVATSSWVGTGSNAADMSSRLTILEVETGRVRFDSGDQKSILTGYLQFSPDGHRLVAIKYRASLESSLMIVDVETGRKVESESLPSESRPGFFFLPRVTFNPDGRSLVVASISGPAQVRDAETGRVVRSLSLGVSGTDDVVIRRSDGRLLSISGDDLREWDLSPARPASLDTGLVLKNLGGLAESHFPQPFLLAAGGRQLLVGQATVDPSKPGEFAIHNVTTGEIIRHFPSREPGAFRDPNSQISSMQSNSAGTRLAAVVGNTWSRDQSTYRLRIWDLTTGRQLLTLDRDRLGGLPATTATLLQAWNDAGTRLAWIVQHADIGPNGKMEVRAEWAVAILEVPSGRIVRKIPTGASRPVASVRPGGTLLAIGTTLAGVRGNVTRVELVDLASGRIVMQRSGDLATLRELIFSPDGRRLAASGDNRIDDNRSRILIWDLAPGAPLEPVRIESAFVHALAFNPDSRRLATGSRHLTFKSGKVQLWDTATGRDLATWSITSGLPQDLAFDAEGRQLRVANFIYGREDVSITRFDASPLAPEIEAVDLVNRLGPDEPINADLATKIDSEPGIDPAVRAVAHNMVSERVESFSALRSRVARWLELDESERTPELMHRALVHIEHAMGQIEGPDVNTLSIQAEARYRNGLYSEALAALRQAESRRDETTEEDPGLPAKLQAYIAMAEARLGHRAQAETALANYRRLWVEANPKATIPPALLIEVEKTVGDAFKATGITR